MASSSAEEQEAVPDMQPPPSPGAAMISNLLSKLKPPNILRDTAWIPRYRETCYPPPPPAQQEGESSPSESPASSGDEASDGPLPTSWHDHLASAPAEAYTSAFSSLLSSALTPPSLVWFGEQHHQPHVIRAQIQLLAAISDHFAAQSAGEDRRATQASAAAATSPNRPVRYHLHLLLEHFSLSDQPLLDRFRLGLLDAGELCAAYRERSDEKFQVEMYAPLLLLARERGVNVWGGFPKRGWARGVVKEGVGSVEGWERQRSAGEEEAAQGYAEETKKSLVPLPPLATSERRIIPTFTAWSHVTHLSRSHRSFLDSLMKPHLPPYFPQLPISSSETESSPSIAQLAEGLRSLAPPSAIEKGFAPAQALKDAYLGHAAGCLLREGHLLAKGENGTESPGMVAAKDRNNEEEDVEHRNIVMVVAGLGHVQAGFGAPERVVREIVEGSVSGQKDAKRERDSLIVLSMPKDSSLWLGPEWRAPSAGEVEAGAAQPSSRNDGTLAQSKAASESAAAEGKEAVIPEGWDRKLADAIVLYDWVDWEKENEKKAAAAATPASDQASPSAAAAAAQGQGHSKSSAEGSRDAKGEKKTS
ncbi:hypothetical protein BDZ90DRAFT_232687 [Jaminaea rosea]|uniref:Haem-binding uptake Tiki superfamily ChaN domain-containing protein n=1 Tax=Jaminaea rosea TaxID=1569628 RepID=A0A316UPA8_9BASI|nr:hypothetical protein BDZ90DRAFT_232687 [Jaminaea rosea]PWN27127.1 hypothetical protein BDZ90DRAFT_232687 [Jaminaea rosea]